MTTLVGRVLRPLRADPSRSPLARAELMADQEIILTSPDFSDGTSIPSAAAGPGVGDNISPTLQWRQVPTTTAQLVLLLDDIDVPLPTPLMHTAAMLPPTATRIAAGALRRGEAGVRIIPTRLAKDGYSGPRPIRGHGPHRYRFHLLASDIPIPQDVGTVRTLLSMLSGHVIARGQLTGTYERR
ncbi:YbhB/YbcL family Raf kinase inhibitor-like protein [Mycobacteroides franklinii]|uniref:YbhB/YbcL family Raf kinase inhibitor-like protein n=1 Tax=Mycobacteroides franklinii TaxID=948102 RepID=UPI0009925793|nr:YbhB/YbcL family Raf kinase inhibitor-like protein [Mycobacteroides franklinii]